MHILTLPRETKMDLFLKYWSNCSAIVCERSIGGNRYLFPLLTHILASESIIAKMHATWLCQLAFLDNGEKVARTANKSIAANIILLPKHRCDADTVPLVFAAFAFVLVASASAYDAAIATKNDATAMVVCRNRRAVDHFCAECILFLTSSSSTKISSSDLIIIER